LTLRAIATMLIRALPPAERAALGAIFMTSGDHEYANDGDDWNRSGQGMQAVLRLAQIPSASLDSSPDAPLFYIHLGASQRTILRDVEDQVRRWKRHRGISERRFHTEKLPLYLQVWDLREGWTGKSYDRALEQTLRQIAFRLEVSVSTVASRYGSAFNMITGHDFSPNVWQRIMGPLKLSEVFVNAETIVSAPVRRRLQSPIRRPVPDSVVTPKAQKPHAVSAVEHETAYIDGGQMYVDYLMDIEELTAKGLSDQEIAQRLEVDVKVIAYLRGRAGEFRQI
jgi:hypothetical protein